MKIILALACVLLVSTLLHAEPGVRLGDLRLVRVASPEGTTGLREYIPAGEERGRWSRLVSVRTFANQKDPKAYLGAVAQAVQKSDPSAMHQFFMDQKTRQLVLDFLVFSRSGAPEKFAEWNLMRAEYRKGRGVVVFQYAMRFYNFREEDGAKIVTERERMIESFKNASFEEEGE